MGVKGDVTPKQCYMIKFFASGLLDVFHSARGERVRRGVRLEEKKRQTRSNRSRFRCRRIYEIQGKTISPKPQFDQVRS